MAKSRRKEPKQPVTAEKDKRVVRATNRRARRNYVISAEFEAGIVLQGSEVKSLRLTTPTLTEAWVRIEDGAPFVHGLQIQPLPQASYNNHEPGRPRKLLLHKREIRKLETLLGQDGTTCVILSLYFKGPHVKVACGVGRGRRKADKRQHEREKEDRRRIRDHT